MKEPCGLVSIKLKSLCEAHCQITIICNCSTLVFQTFAKFRRRKRKHGGADDWGYTAADSAGLGSMVCVFNIDILNHGYIVSLTLSQLF